MRAERFDTILNERLEKIRRVLEAKASEYTSAADRLHNFKRAAAVLGTTPAKALLGMWVKHVVSIMDLVDEDAGARDDRFYALLDEKVGDAVNYLILLEAILRESQRAPDQPNTGDVPPPVSVVPGPGPGP